MLLHAPAGSVSTAASTITDFIRERRCAYGRPRLAVCLCPTPTPTSPRPERGSAEGIKPRILLCFAYYAWPATTNHANFCSGWIGGYRIGQANERACGGMDADRAELRAAVYRLPPSRIGRVCGFEIFIITYHTLHRSSLETMARRLHGLLSARPTESNVLFSARMIGPDRKVRPAPSTPAGTPTRQ